jgi:hypothetical protein
MNDVSDTGFKLNGLNFFSELNRKFVKKETIEINCGHTYFDFVSENNFVTRYGPLLNVAMLGGFRVIVKDYVKAVII